MDFWFRDNFVNTRAYEAFLCMRSVAIVLASLEIASFWPLMLVQLYLNKNKVQILISVILLIIAIFGLVWDLRVRSTQVLVHGTLITIIFSGALIFLTVIMIWWKNYEKLSWLFLSLPFLASGIFHIIFGIKIDKLSQNELRLPFIQRP